MVTVDELGGKERISTAHPVYGATLRATLPVLRRRAVCSSLAHVMLDRGPRDPGDRLMAASWLLEAGEQPPHGLAEVAAEEALAKGDAQLADRLASAAVAQSESVDALTTLATAKSVQHATDEARPLFERALAAAATDGERVRAVTALARHEAWIGQDPVRATALLEQTLPTLKSSDARAELGVELATFAAVGGNAVDTARVAGQALDDAGAEPRLVVSALVWSTLARCMLGWADGLERDLARGEVLAREFRNTLPQARDQLQINRAMWLQAVDLVAALRLVRAGHERAVRQGGLAGVWSTTQLLIVRDIGNLDRALGLARRAIGELERFDPFNNLPMVCAVASHVHSLRGEARAAAQWMERAGPVDHMEPRTRVHGDRAQVWLGMHGPEIAAAAAVEAGERAEAGTMVLWSVPLYHDAVRMGVPGLAVAPLSRLASRIDAPVVAAMARHAEAAAAGDPAGLTRVATEFEQLGSLILAAEALAQAGRWAGSDTPEAARAALRALRLAARCPGAATPPLAGMVSALTPREMEIATAAAAGRASRDIAEWLVLSTRTVDNHLASVYRKLGLSGRDELSGVIGAVDDRRVEGLESG